jgi:hypothetical protein
LYYGVPILTIEGLELGLGDFTEPDAYFKTLFFPLTMIGMGPKISRWSLPTQVASSSVGALLSMWSAQVVAEKLMDAVDALVL